MVERKGAKGLESLGLYLKLRFPLFFRCILLKLFSLSEAHFLHQFMCFGLRVIKMQLKVVGIIEICFSHKSRCPEVARGVSGYYIGSPFVTVLPFSSCLQYGCSSANHCILWDRSEDRMGGMGPLLACLCLTITLPRRLPLSSHWPGSSHLSILGAGDAEKAPS